MKADAYISVFITRNQRLKSCKLTWFPAKINVKNKALCQIVVMNSFCMKGILSQDAFSYAQMSLILLRNWSRFFIA